MRIRLGIPFCCSEFPWKHKDNSHVFCIFNFNKADAKLIISLPSGVWKKVLDSSDKMWDGPGILLPEKIKFGDMVTIRGLSMALYKGEEI